MHTTKPKQPATIVQTTEHAAEWNQPRLKESQQCLTAAQEHQLENEEDS